MSDLIFKVMTWSLDQTPQRDSPTVIHLGGLTEHNETVHIIVEDFMPYVYMELPARIQWTKKLVNALQEKLEEQFGSLIEIQKYGMMHRYLHLEKRVMFVLRLKNLKYSWALARGIKRCYYLPGGVRIGDNELKIHETKTIDSIIKYATVKDFKMAGWVKVRSFKNTRVADARYSARVNYELVDPVNDPVYDSKTINPFYFSFDIECNSKNHDSKIPDPLIPENVITHIGIVSGRIGQSGYERLCLSLALGTSLVKDENRMECIHDGKDTSVSLIQRERDLLLRFFGLIKSMNPDVFMGYNIMKFDWPYIIRRSEFHGILGHLFSCSRALDSPGYIQSVKWMSAAYGEQEFESVMLHGRMHLDTILDVERNFKLPTYSLNYVSQRFLNAGKDDIKPREIFMVWKLYEDYYTHLDSMDHAAFETMRNRITSQLMRARQTHGIILKYRNKFLKRAGRYDPVGCKSTIQKMVGVIGDYCIKDCILPVELSCFFSSWDTLVGMSNVMCVPMQYIYTRGQQIRVISQILRRTLPKSIVVQSDGLATREYQGATVLEVYPGKYGLVFTLDFTSLYPTLTNAYNLCMSTILPLERVKDLNPKEYRIFKTSEHVGCEHDTKLKKQADIKKLCAENTYAFLRVQYVVDPVDGTYKEKNRGILPELISDLLAQRRKAKAEMGFHSKKVKELKKALSECPSGPDGHSAEELSKELEYHKGRETIKNAEQLAVKVSTNSTYGANGSKNGVLGCTPIASIITAMGRRSLKNAIGELLKEIPEARIVYGDSCPGYTPVLVRVKGRMIVSTMESLFRTTEYTNGIDGKEYYHPNGLEVWADGGFTRVESVMRHALTKEVYRVRTLSSVVDVTEDHSLITRNGQVLTGSQASPGTSLLSQNYPPIIKRGTGSEPLAYVLGASLSHLLKIKDSWWICSREKQCLEKAQAILTKSGTLVRLLRRKSEVLPWALGPIPTRVLAPLATPSVATVVGTGFTVPDAAIDLWDTQSKTDLVQGMIDIQGYNDGRTVSISVRTQLNTAKLVWILAMLGYKTTIIPHLNDYYNVHLHPVGTGTDEDHTILDCSKLDSLSMEYVYDLTTANHHYQAGVGTLVVHNTDSAMLYLDGCTDRSIVRETAKRASKIATHKIICDVVGIETNQKMRHKNGIDTYDIRDVNPTHPAFKDIVYDDQCAIIEYHQCPMNLEFENIYDQFFLRTKKRYTAYTIENEYDKKKTNKGVVTTRRDYAKFTQDVYNDVDEAILSGESYDQVMDILNKHLGALYGMRVNHSKLVIYMGISKIISYAKHIKDKTQGRGNKGAVLYYVDKEGKPIENVTDPLDPRLVYTNMVQSTLGLKMLKRGEILPPNTRLEYLYILNPNASCQSDNAEEYSYFLEHYRDQGMIPDLDYYANSLLGSTEDKQVVEMLRIRYRGDVILYYGPWNKEFNRILDYILKIAQDALSDECRRVLYQVDTCKTFVLCTTDDPALDRHWEYQPNTETCFAYRYSPGPQKVLLRSKKLLAKIDMVIALSKLPEHSLWLNSSYQYQSRSLLSAALLHKSLYTVHRMCSQHGLESWAKRYKIPVVPKNSGDKIRCVKYKHPKMITLAPLGHVPIYTPVYIVTREESESDLGGYTYTAVTLDDEACEKPIHGIRRDQLISFHHRDDFALSNLISYHRTWRTVVDQLQVLCDRL